ncbi:MAG: iron-containing alcohol dehydrogenase [Pseudomonadota bacterium]
MQPINDFLQHADWTFPVPIAYGPGRFEELPDHCHRLGLSSPLIITDCGTASLGFVADAADLLARAGIVSTVFHNISQNPTEIDVRNAHSVFRSGNHDGVIAIGGGSGMDAGKATVLLAGSKHDLWEHDFEKVPPELDPADKFPPLICIPTTSGTGAETESTAMITNLDRGMKLCVWHPLLKPTLAILDPKLTLGLPPNLTAWTGVDALVHALEAYCVPRIHPMCDGIALAALNLIGRWLPVAVFDSQNLNARGAMQVASCMAGVAFLKGLGLVHSISHAIGAEYDTHHGLTNAIALPAVMRFNAPSIRDKCPEISRALQLDGPNFDEIYHWICQLLDLLEIPKCLDEIGVEKAKVSSIAKRAFSDSATGTNPRKLDLEELEMVLLEAISRGR